MLSIPSHTLRCKSGFQRAEVDFDRFGKNLVDVGKHPADLIFSDQKCGSILIKLEYFANLLHFLHERIVRLSLHGSRLRLQLQTMVFVQQVLCRIVFPHLLAKIVIVFVLRAVLELCGELPRRIINHTLPSIGVRLVSLFKRDLSRVRMLFLMLA